MYSPRYMCQANGSMVQLKVGHQTGVAGWNLTHAVVYYKEIQEIDSDFVLRMNLSNIAMTVRNNEIQLLICSNEQTQIQKIDLRQ